MNHPDIDSSRSLPAAVLTGLCLALALAHKDYHERPRMLLLLPEHPFR